MEKKCECRLCTENRLRDAEVASGDPVRMAKLIGELRDELMNVDFDNSWYRAIHEGSWPNAVEILERALARAKQHDKTRTDR